MERADAEKLRDRMVAGHADRTTHSFILSESDGEWGVAKVALPPSAGESARPGVSDTTEPLHSHNGNMLPGGVPNWTGV